MLFQVLASILLAFVGFSDVKTRSFHVGYWLVYAILGLIYFYSSYNVRSDDLLNNLIFLVAVIGGVWVYFKLRRGSNLAFFRDYLGIGDVLLFLATCFFFDTDSYVFFFFMTVFSAALVYGLIYFVNRSEDTIPLALFISLSFSVTWIASKVVEY